MLPIAQAIENDDILGMATPGKRGRRPSIPLATRHEMAGRVKHYRTEAKLSYGQIAAELSKWVEREITWDSYRQWEDDTPIPQDLIIPFCYITGADPFRLLQGEPYRTTNVVPITSGKRRVS